MLLLFVYKLTIDIIASAYAVYRGTYNVGCWCHAWL